VSTHERKAELQLIDRALQGSVEAFEQLVINYQDRLYCFLLTRAASRADAQDALQDTFVAVYRYLPGYRPRYRFSTWIFTIAVRQLGRQRRHHPETTDLLESVACGQAGPEQIGMQVEQQRSLWQTARLCLNEFQFTALWLFYIEDMSLAEIGKVMKRPASWVKVNLMRARRRLSRELQDYHFDPAVSCNEVSL